LAGEDAAGKYRRESWLLSATKQNFSEAALTSESVINKARVIISDIG
jgi:hypothetical protein